MSRRRLLAPEVVQTSAMDCGPAALKCLLEGHGLTASYGRLREACRTDVDGTSIDSLEDIARLLGLEAEQIMVPKDHLLRIESESLPAIVVVRHSDGLLHFVVAWRVHGPWVQVMDPAVGRRWMRRERFLEQVYVHEHPISAEQWRSYVVSDLFQRPLRKRLEALVRRRRASALLEGHSEDASALARLEAAVHFVEMLKRSRSLGGGAEAESVLRALMADGAPDLPDDQRCAVLGDDEVTLRGAVLVRIVGVSPAGKGESLPELGAELTAAVTEPKARPWRELTRYLGTAPWRVLGLAGTIVFAAVCIVIEALLFRGALEIGTELELVTSRSSAMSLLVVFLLALLLVELGVAGGVRRLGRQLEMRLRLAIARKVPRLADRYFRSRPISDMAERCHSLHQMRSLPHVGASLLTSATGVVVIAAAIAWLHPPGAVFALLAALFAIGLPLLFLPSLSEVDLRLRTHTGALGRFYLDALLGLAAIKAHAGERAILRQQEGLLTDWWTSNRERRRLVVWLEVLQASTGITLALLLLATSTTSAADPTGALLLAYWALSLPALGEEIAMQLRGLPLYRNLALRLFEPLTAPEPEIGGGGDTTVARAEDAGRSETSGAARSAGESGVGIQWEGVSVRASGHSILEDVCLEVAPGEHVAIVGGSGAGKSSLMSLLLGWHRCQAGCVRIDGRELDDAPLRSLRRQTVWVDPTVQLWNRSLLSNITFGNEGERGSLNHVVRSAGLLSVLDHLPKGLQTPLGESGRLLSGGQGQRVRLARGLFRSEARLVILDEPFRGLDHRQRRELLASARQQWKGATLFLVTHDIDLARSFERVLVVEGGRIIEDGSPESLAALASSRFAALLEAEREMRDALFEDPAWRRWRIADRSLVESKRGEA